MADQQRLAPLFWTLLFLRIVGASWLICACAECLLRTDNCLWHSVSVRLGSKLNLDDRVLSSPESRMARLTKITTITRCLYGNLRIETCLRLLGAVLAAYLFSKVRPTDFGVPMSAQHLQEQLTLGRECDRMCMSNACRALILLHAMFTWSSTDYFVFFWACVAFQPSRLWMPMRILRFAGFTSTWRSGLIWFMHAYVTCIQYVSRQMTWSGWTALSWGSASSWAFPCWSWRWHAPSWEVGIYGCGRSNTFVFVILSTKIHFVFTCFK